MCINDGGFPKPVIQFCVKLYAIKEISGLTGDEIRVGLHRVGKKRVKSTKAEVDIVPFVQGFFCNLALCSLLICHI